FYGKSVCPLRVSQNDRLQTTAR
ncbi:hypothetical protein D029_0880B, partial [Vibrio parahaemolyticus 970107]